jgi:hypothetical protein
MLSRALCTGTTTASATTSSLATTGAISSAPAGVGDAAAVAPSRPKNQYAPPAATTATTTSMMIHLLMLHLPTFHRSCGSFYL